jgi:hypothetical protein
MSSTAIWLFPVAIGTEQRKNQSQFSASFAASGCLVPGLEFLALHHQSVSFRIGRICSAGMVGFCAQADSKPFPDFG